MVFDFILKGFLIGLPIAMVVGPISVLCVQKTYDQGRNVGLATGTGAALADATYGSIAAFGLVVLIAWMQEYVLWFRVVGGLFLLYLGWQAATKQKIKLKLGKTIDKKANLFRDFTTTFFLTMTNPATILSFMAIFAGIGIEKQTGFVLPMAMVLGVFLGSMLWWIILTDMVERMRQRFGAKLLRAINLGSGVILGSFGLFILVKAIMEII